ncbi:DNA-binding transcriptional regulator, MarR family [Burkholderia sp. OK233]|nr:DNA-binding transcriptional regulator, MarR family [Burkholderia sp. OK233]
MIDVIDATRLGSRIKAMERAHRKDKHQYFKGIATARYVLRKVFRIVEEQAKEAGLDSIAHQALIQIYGSEDKRLRVKDLADRLDISPAFGSNLTRALVEKGFVERIRGDEDLRTTLVAITEAGSEVLHRIDEAVSYHVDYFTHQLSREEREMTVYIMMFYVGITFGPSK